LVTAKRNLAEVLSAYRFATALIEKLSIEYDTLEVGDSAAPLLKMLRELADRAHAKMMSRLAPANGMNKSRAGRD
jgi:hypothetical protein